MLPQSLRILNMKTSLLYDRAAEIITKTNNPSISLLRVKLNISLDEAEQIMDYFVSIGFISDYHNTRPVILKQYVSSFRLMILVSLGQGSYNIRTTVSH